MLTEVVAAAVQAADIWVAELRGDDITDTQRETFWRELFLNVLYGLRDGDTYKIAPGSGYGGIRLIEDALKSAGLYYRHIPLNLTVWVGPGGVWVSRYPQEEAV